MSHSLLHFFPRLGVDAPLFKQRSCLRFDSSEPKNLEKSQNNAPQNTTQQNEAAADALKRLSSGSNSATDRVQYGNPNGPDFNLGGPGRGGIVDTRSMKPTDTPKTDTKTDAPKEGAPKTDTKTDAPKEGAPKTDTKTETQLNPTQKAKQEAAASEKNASEAQAASDKAQKDLADAKKASEKESAEAEQAKTKVDELERTAKEASERSEEATKKAAEAKEKATDYFLRTDGTIARADSVDERSGKYASVGPDGKARMDDIPKNPEQSRVSREFGEAYLKLPEKERAAFLKQGQADAKYLRDNLTQMIQRAVPEGVHQQSLKDALSKVDGGALAPETVKTIKESVAWDIAKEMLDSTKSYAELSPDQQKRAQDAQRMILKGLNLGSPMDKLAERAEMEYSAGTTSANTPYLNTSEPNLTTTQASTLPTTPSLTTPERMKDNPDWVQSPSGKPGQYVDISGIAPGKEVIDPFTGKRFTVPASATSAPTPKLASPATTPPAKPETKKDDPKKDETKPATPPPTSDKTPKTYKKDDLKEFQLGKETGSPGFAVYEFSYNGKIYYYNEKNDGVFSGIIRDVNGKTVSLEDIKGK